MQLRGMYMLVDGAAAVPISLGGVALAQQSRFAALFTALAAGLGF